jgi:dTDP-4-dehydrorhamnose reductase
MKIVVTGARGQVGWELSRSLAVLGVVHAWDRTQADLDRPDALADALRALRPDLIVNAAAYTAVDRAESEEVLACRINGRGVGVLADVAREIGALLVHYSSDYVFDGAAQAPYREHAVAAPQNAYGRSKLLGDQAIAASGADHLIFRTTWVYSARGANFLLTMLRLMRERPELRVVADQFGAPTSARFIAEATAHAVRQSFGARAQGRFESGLFNLTAEGVTSWHGFAQYILECARELQGGAPLLTERILAIPASEYPVPAVRPHYSVLDGGKFEQHFGLRRPSWQEGVRHVLEELLAR